MLPMTSFLLQALSYTKTNVMTRLNVPHNSAIKDYVLKTYDDLFILRGPLDTQKFPDLIKTSLYTLQNTMSRLDFKSCLECIVQWRLNQFADISIKEAPEKTQNKIMSTIQVITHQSFIT